VLALSDPPPSESDHLSAREFERLARLINSYSGIKMPPSKRTMVELRLRRRLRATGLPSLGAYCRFLFEQGGLADEMVHLIDAVTTNKTEFFREPDHFRLLSSTAAPRLLADRRAGSRKLLKFWSAGCSTGAEAYTIAMVMSEFAQRTGEADFSIIGTDICTEVLSEAVCGIYPDAMMAPVPAELRARYARRSKDRSLGLTRIAPALRSKAAFGRMNLMDSSYPLERDMDVVFCRNTLIYFDKPTQNAVLERLCDHLRPGGYLFLGHSETLSGFDLPLAPAGPTTFRKLS
jgi:chemotaxis protein methyltransferase CheR